MIGLSNEYSHVPPVKGLHKMIRSSGYQPEDCILEYTDNSIDADAKEIDILLYACSEEEPNIERICIVDKGGKGMNKDELLHGLTIAFTRIHSEEDIGLYGFGMKSASLNLGNELLVVSKQSGSHGFIGARMDFQEQEKENDYKPTNTSLSAQADLFTHLPSDVRRELSSMVGTKKSVTFIQITRLHHGLASIHCNTFRDTLVKKLRLAYSCDKLSDVNMKIKIIKANTEEVTITRVDPFYLNQPECLRKEAIQLQLYAIIPNNTRENIRILEKSTFRRSWKKGTTEVSYTSGTPEHPIYYDLGGENLRAVDNPFEKPIPNTRPPIPFTMTLVFLKKETYDKEDEDLRKKGIWFRRGVRMVAQGLTLGIHGISAHGHYNQMRACVTFPPQMDKLMGAKYNKQINPKNGAVKEAIVRVWKDITSQWVKEKENTRKKIQEKSQEEQKDTTNATEEQETEGGVDTIVSNNLSPWVVIANEKKSADDGEATQPEPPHIVITDGRLYLRVANVDVAGVDGFGKNSNLKPWLERVLERKGVNIVTQLLQQMNTILTN